MKWIKKVKISNLPETSGSIVDSLNAQVDKQSNAPSINAVNEALAEINSNIESKINEIKSGNVATASKLKNSRKIKLKGAISGEISFDGSQDVTINVIQDNIAIIQGSMLIPAGPDNVQFVSKTEHINFPEGFNKDNCFAISIGTKLIEGGTGYGYGLTDKWDVFAISTNLLPFSVLLGDGDENGNKIQIVGQNFIMQEVNMRYQIVLMKKNEEVQQNG